MPGTHYRDHTRRTALQKIDRKQRHVVRHVNQLAPGYWLTPEHGSDAYKIAIVEETRVLLQGGYFLPLDSVFQQWYISRYLPAGFHHGEPSKRLSIKSISDLDKLIENKIFDREKMIEEREREMRNVMRKGFLE